MSVTTRGGGNDDRHAFVAIGESIAATAARETYIAKAKAGTQRPPIDLSVISAHELVKTQACLDGYAYVGRPTSYSKALAARGMLDFSVLGNPHPVENRIPGPAAFAYLHELVAGTTKLAKTAPQKLDELAKLATDNGTLPIVCFGCIPCHGHAIAQAVAARLTKAGHEVSLDAKDRACVELMRTESRAPHKTPMEAYQATKQRIDKIREDAKGRAVATATRDPLAGALGDPLAGAPPVRESARPASVTAEAISTEKLERDVLAYVTIIGARDIAGNEKKGIQRDDAAMDIARLVGRKVAEVGLGDICGWAPGADAEGARGVKDVNGNPVAVLGILPRDGFQGKVVNGLNNYTLAPAEYERAVAIASLLHPNPEAMKKSRFAVDAHARNIGELFWKDLKDPVHLLVAVKKPTYLRDGSIDIGGGSHTAYVGAQRAGIPVYPVLDPNSLLNFLKRIDDMRSGALAMRSGKPLQMTVEVAMNTAPHRAYIAGGGQGVDELCQTLKNKGVRYLLDTTGTLDEDAVAQAGIKLLDARAPFTARSYEAAIATPAFVTEVERIIKGATNGHGIAVYTDSVNPTQSRLTPTLAIGLGAGGVQPVFLEAGKEEYGLVEAIGQLQRQFGGVHQPSLDQAIGSLEAHLRNDRRNETPVHDRTEAEHPPDVLQQDLVTR